LSLRRPPLGVALAAVRELFTLAGDLAVDPFDDALDEPFGHVGDLAAVGLASRSSTSSSSSETSCEFSAARA